MIQNTTFQEETDHVRASTADEVKQRIDRNIDQRLHYYASQSPEIISERINQLEKEWDIERFLQANASMLAFLGLTLGMTRNRKWFLLPCLVLPFLFQHAVQGWCPPVPLLRRLGVRTRSEIDLEKYALKALRGDFGPNLHQGSSTERADCALAAVKA